MSKQKLDDAIAQSASGKSEFSMPTPQLGPTPMPRRKQVDLAKIDNALIVNQDGEITFNGFTLSGAGVGVEDSATEQNMSKLLEILIRLSDRAQLLIADALAQCERAGWGEAIKYAEQLGVSSKTMSNSISALRNVSYSLRREVLSQYDLNEFEPTVSHYVILQGLDEKEQRDYLHALMRDKLSRRKLQELIYGESDSGRRTKDEKYESTFNDLEDWLPKQSKKKRRDYVSRLRKIIALVEADL